MELGATYLDAAATICIAAILLAILMALVLKRFTRMRRVDTLTFAAILFCALAAGGSFLHRPLFRGWHRSRNTVLPQSGCLTYEPSFFRLYATYRMGRGEFDDWVKEHPWRLIPQDAPAIAIEDARHLGFGQIDAAYASEPEPNGRQLRVYYAEDTVYVSYSAM